MSHSSQSYVPSMPAIPSGGSLSPSSSSFDLPTLHVGATMSLDREARVNRYVQKTCDGPCADPGLSFAFVGMALLASRELAADPPLIQGFS
jgi:hypothetical protein